MMGDSRADPFDLSEFTPTPKKKPRIDDAAIREVANANRFTSRERSDVAPASARTPAPSEAPAAPTVRRRYTTGRNVQFNMKVTQETLNRAHRLIGRLGPRATLGEMLEQALEALERELDQQQQ